jgi:hypothetical protein
MFMAKQDWVSKVIEELSKQPAYLLVFALCALFFLSGIGTAVAGVIKNGNIDYLIISALLCIASLVCAVVVIFRVTGAGPSLGEHRLIHLSAVMGESAKGHDLGDAILAVSENALKAMGLDNVALTEAVIATLEEVRATSSKWANGELSLVGADSNRMLLRMYEQAQKNVFATVVPEYLDEVWIKPYGVQLLRVQEVGRAQVTRVFIFDDRKGLTEQRIKNMELHVNAKVTVYAYFDKEDDLFQFKKDMPRDFTIIDDGLAIGVTISINPNSIGASWYIDQKDKRKYFEDIKGNLLRGSVPFSEVKKWWSERPKTTANTSIPKTDQVIENN